MTDTKVISSVSLTPDAFRFWPYAIAYNAVGVASDKGQHIRMVVAPQFQM